MWWRRMPSCEKCWSDSRMASYSEGNAYSRILSERDAAGRVCTPEEQAGPDATECPKCERRTCHQHCGICMICGWTSHE
jgi:hypothetical protein